MDYYTILALLLPFLWALFHLLKLKPTSPKLADVNPLPPGPRPLPIIGNLHQLGERPHRFLADVAKLYGSVISLRFGSITTVVVSSAEAAREMFQKRDLALSSRKVPAAVRENGHDAFSMAWLPVTPKWRLLRKISAVHLFSSQRLDGRQSLRQAQVAELLEYVKGRSNSGEPVDIGEAAFTTSLNLLSNTFFSMDLASYSSAAAGEFKELVWKIMEEIGKPNLADCFPVLGFLRKVSVNRELMGYGNKLNEVFKRIVDERLSLGYDGEEDGCNGDVLDILIRLMKEDDSELTLHDIMHLLMDFFTAGTDTTSSTLEWSMTELLHNPEKMAKAQAELGEVLGKGTAVQESDISRLPYLQAIVKETLRMHPPTVFLLPRKADDDVELLGYTIPKNAQVFVNLWAISYDPKTWENPEKFSPERFLDKDIDMKGQDFGFIPFGAGRRICPGLTLAYRMLNLMLGTLIHGFNWKLGDGLNPKDMDMNDKFGITIQKAIPLRVIPTPK